MHTNDYDYDYDGSGGDGRRALPRTGTDTGAGTGREPVVCGQGQEGQGQEGQGQEEGEGQVVLVTGATGTVGGEVVRALPARLPAGMGVRVMARDPARAAAMFPGVEAVAGDYTDPPSLAGALRGCGRRSW